MASLLPPDINDNSKKKASLKPPNYDKVGKKSKKPGIDSYLNVHARSIGIGQEIRFQLIRGPAFLESADPTDPKAVEVFPVVAKFPESVVKPDFRKFKRFYQQDVPSKKEDSDDEAMIAQAQLLQAQRRKKRRYRRNEGPKRQWILQQEEDYLESQIAKKRLGKSFKLDQNSRSTRYEGMAEHNASNYFLMGAPANTNSRTLNITMLPTPHAVYTFSQPAKLSTLSMSAAEQAIENQRAHMTRYMMHGEGKASGGAGAGAGGASVEPPSSQDRLMGRLKKMSSARTGEEDNDDDVMGDLKFASRKGGGSRARKELLQTLADGVSMDADGVLGGANDALFGGKRRFMKMNANNNQDAKKKDKKSSSGAAGQSSNGGMCMAGDFYQRDVEAEYKELDFDATEQFDNDDVNMGEGEVVENAGYGNHYDDSDGDEMDEEDDEDDEDGDDNNEKRRGLATIRGLKELLKKQRGEIINMDPNNPTPGGANNNNNSPKEGTDDGIGSASADATEEAAVKSFPKGPSLDEKGQRILSMEGVRYEIFLHNKSIAMKKLMKLYNIKKRSSKEKIVQFQQIIKELCNMHKDPVHGNMLVLKQHYAKGI